jgi:hypothetical protein
MGFCLNLDLAIWTVSPATPCIAGEKRPNRRKFRQAID